MRAIKNIQIIDFLWIEGLKPLYELNGVAYYECSKLLLSLLDRYFIIHSCIPNKVGAY